MTERVCILCKKFRMYPADPGYSDITPGSDLSMYCRLEYWSLDVYRDHEDTYRAKITMAKDCKDYVYYKD